MNPMPLCVDLDGTLVRTDLFFESVLLMCKSRPWAALCLPYWLLRHGRAWTKLKIAALATPLPRLLPYSDPVLDYLKDQKSTGRKTVLVTASTQSQAEAVAEHLGLFDEVIATRDAQVNLASRAKAKCLVERFGEHGFEYLGNSRADLPVWRASGAVGIVNAGRRLQRRAAHVGVPVVYESNPPRRRGRALLREMRPHQWLKNLLVFVPLLAAHRQGEWALLGRAGLAFLAFSLVSSSVYVLNDMLDIESDRVHHRKRQRPFASGSLPLPTGLLLMLGLLAAAGMVLQALPSVFAVVMGIYYVATLLYSFRLKRQVMVDVMLLSALYTLRVLAGGAAVSIVPSYWLLAFSIFIFLSLALIKRYSEMNQLQRNNEERAAGRGYAVSDLSILPALGCAAGFNAVQVLAQYINSPDVTRMYASPALLWLVVPIMVYWISRMWFKSHRGELHDDPIVFAVTDWQSLTLGLLMMLVIAAASRPLL